MLVIRSTALFDGQGCLPRLATVLVDDGTILGVEQGWPDPPEHAEVLNLGEVTVLPGLVDTHVHLVGDSEWGALDRVAGYSPRQEPAGAGCVPREVEGVCGLGGDAAGLVDVTGLEVHGGDVCEEDGSLLDGLQGERRPPTRSDADPPPQPDLGDHERLQRGVLG
jgi:hypothetical protein